MVALKMMRRLKQGEGWRLGWDPNALEFQGLVGTTDWAVELTESEFEDFCRLLLQLADTITEVSAELMAEETISCEASSEWIWMQVRGYPHAYGLSMILLTGRRAEGEWSSTATTALLQAVQTLEVF